MPFLADPGFRGTIPPTAEVICEGRDESRGPDLLVLSRPGAPVFEAQVLVPVSAL
jgi:hypothetical protein